VVVGAAVMLFATYVCMCVCLLLLSSLHLVLLSYLKVLTVMDNISLN